MTTAQQVVVTAMATDDLGVVLPDVLNVLGFQIDADMDEIIEFYGNRYYEWLLVQLEMFGQSPQDEKSIITFHNVMLNLFVHQIILVEIKKGSIKIN
jgi:hypothetical protein